jgi:hypothetical protein
MSEPETGGNAPKPERPTRRRRERLTLLKVIRDPFGGTGSLPRRRVNKVPSRPRDPLASAREAVSGLALGGVVFSLIGVLWSCVLWTYDSTHTSMKISLLQIAGIAAAWTLLRLIPSWRVVVAGIVIVAGLYLLSCGMCMGWRP